eukprot:350655-Chlamydomonas_euryale.AAC.7
MWPPSQDLSHVAACVCGQRKAQRVQTVAAGANSDSGCKPSQRVQTVAHVQEPRLTPWNEQLRSRGCFPRGCCPVG